MGWGGHVGLVFRFSSQKGSFRRSSGHCLGWCQSVEIGSPRGGKFPILGPDIFNAVKTRKSPIIVTLSHFELFQIPACEKFHKGLVKNFTRP